MGLLAAASVHPGEDLIAGVVRALDVGERGGSGRWAQLAAKRTARATARRRFMRALMAAWFFVAPTARCSRAC